MRTHRNLSSRNLLECPCNPHIHWTQWSMAEGVDRDIIFRLVRIYLCITQKNSNAVKFKNRYVRWICIGRLCDSRQRRAKKQINIWWKLRDYKGITNNIFDSIDLMSRGESHLNGKLSNRWWRNRAAHNTSPWGKFAMLMFCSIYESHHVQCLHALLSWNTCLQYLCQWQSKVLIIGRNIHV